MLITLWKLLPSRVLSHRFPTHCNKFDFHVRGFLVIYLEQVQNLCGNYPALAGCRLVQRKSRVLVGFDRGIGGPYCNLLVWVLIAPAHILIELFWPLTMQDVCQGAERIVPAAFLSYSPQRLAKRIDKISSKYYDWPSHLDH